MKNLEAVRQSIGEETPPAEPLSRAAVLALRFGELSLLKCRQCGGELTLLETYPGKRAPPYPAIARIG